MYKLARGILLLLPIVLVGPVQAQDDGPTFINARLIDVRSDRADEFEAALADISATAQAGGAPFMIVFERMRGDLPAYTLFTLDSVYNDVPNIDLGEALITRVTGASNGSTLYTLAMYPEMSIIPEELDPRPEFMMVRVSTTSPSNAAAFLEFQRDEFTPALREAGVRERRFGRLVAGGNVNTFANFSPTNDFPGQGTNLLLESLGQRDYDRLISRAQSFQTSHEVIMYRYRPDLSFNNGE